MEDWLRSVPYYTCSLVMFLTAAAYTVAIRKRLRAPYYAYKILASLCWAVAFLFIGITAAPLHPLRAEAATLIRSLFLAGGLLQLLWLGFFARAMIGVKAR